MARPRRDAQIDLSEAQDLTAGLIARLNCPAGKAQAFLRDAKASGLRVRVTAAGAKSFVFEAKLNRQTIRRTIGDVRAWSIERARTEANRMRVTLDGGDDPRELEREKQAADAEKRAAAVTDAVTVGEVWTVYLAERRPHWGERHYQDHLNMSKAGGVPAKRGTKGRGVTVAGPIHPLLALRLADLTPETIEAWAAGEAKTRPTAGRLAWRCLKALLGWCGEQAAYNHLVPVNPAKTRKTREAFGRPAVKSDVLLREQLPAWFSAVRNVGNPVISAYLQTLLLIGARPGEVLVLRWEDVDTAWRGMTIRDKVEGERIVPLTPFVSQLLATLPRRNEWVFSSPTAADGVLTIPRHPHLRACKVAGIDGLTLHGLRRSFKSLTEWLEVPVGVVAQIQGHKPSATAEKHYTVRPLDLLRLHHEKIEAWILEQAGIVSETKAAPGALRVVISA
ncbi:MAG TPA: integrase family protein [Castellaniella sp.]|nr:integrase family protein [Castellaniella sp.]